LRGSLLLSSGTHKLLHAALQDEQAAAEQEAGPKQQEQQVDPTKVLEAFASARVRAS
jgi:hypothetical protein